MKFKHSSDVYSNWLDLLIGSIELRQSRQDGFVFTPSAAAPPLPNICHILVLKNKAAAAACWEPKMSYKQHNTWPSETDNL